MEISNYMEACLNILHRNMRVSDVEKERLEKDMKDPDKAHEAYKEVETRLSALCDEIATLVEIKYRERKRQNGR